MHDTLYESDSPQATRIGSNKGAVVEEAVHFEGGTARIHVRRHGINGGK